MVRKTRRNKNPNQAALDSLKAIRGLDRAAHFAAGGSLAEWRGRHTVTTDRKKRDSKRACRGRVRDY